MNKKLFFGLAATFAVAIAAVCTTLALNNSSSPTDLLSKNLEALSQGELDPWKKYSNGLTRIPCRFTFNGYDMMGYELHCFEDSQGEYNCQIGCLTWA